ncbi:uncharacterized protein F4807DRAFT_13749 [Annulohypoxylon truncatum]|uniref:uncharacterized protein n=1 Tax=Annulohypoxylon truncatum TaxID=327061 RepID=UPI0020076E78|nr:uncharacterized protein F4807DRAFT_13749 [Annulohypoxylon truncatum]KAI1214919.1 hypothetical protein F4807DRAFT_13749 [Annulohypoxylon truncatum]
MDPANDTQTQESLERQLHDDDTKSIVHSGKLVYAKPQDLPSFPSIGLLEKGSAASAAAALGWTTNTSPELWRPDKSAPASAAAVMAKDYKLPPPWEPVPSQHGAKAALLASQSAMGPNMSRRPTVSDSGLSAANIAFRSDTSIASTSHSASLEHRRSLLAARGAMANRQRAMSSPVPKESYPDEANAAANALSAATRAHRPVRSPTLSEVSENAGSVPFTNMNRQMFTSRPPVKPEVDDQKRADVLHASALAMAKKMFTQQQKMIDAKKAHDSSTSREHTDALSSVSDDAQPAHLTTLQDAAYKQAQARLAKMHDEHFKDREFQEYYGAKPSSRRFSIRGKLRKRASSDGDVIEDRRRSQHIRQQMTLFSSKLSEVNDQKRQHDQDALLAAAQRNVHERLKGIDEKIAAETGMMPPSTLTQWEIKAHAAAQAESEQRISQAHGKIDIGAGKFMEQEDIDAIAAARVKPVLDEINEKVDEEHARQTELRLEMEKKKEEEEIEKARQKEIQEISKRLKEQDKQEQKERKAEEKQEAKAKKEEDKAAKAEQKQEAKAKKEEERAAKAEQKRLARHEKQKSAADRHSGSPEEPEVEIGTITLNTAGQPVNVPAPEVDEVPTESSEDEAVDRESTSPTERLSKGGVKSWLKSRFSRGRKPSDEDKSKDKSTAKGFIGGVALTGLDRSASADNRSASERAIAMAGKEREPRQRRHTTNYSIENDGMSSNSSEDGCFRDDAREMPRTALTPPRPIKDSSSSTNHSPNRNSKFMEMV